MMESKFFEDTEGSIEESPRKKPEVKSSYGISILNVDDFGHDEAVVSFLESARSNLFHDACEFKKLICKADAKNDLDCEFVFDRSAKDVDFKNILVRYDDLDFLKAQTDNVTIRDGVLYI